MGQRRWVCQRTRWYIWQQTYMQPCLKAQLGPNKEPLARWVTEPNPLASATSQHATQKWWAEQLDEVRSQMVDGFGHLVCCEQNGCATRHNAFRNAFFAVCVQHGIAVEKEPTCLAGMRPADVLLLLWTRGQYFAVDFVCTHPAGPAQYPLVQRVLCPSISLGRGKRGIALQSG